MKRVYDEYEQNLIHFKKRSSNKVGILIILILVIALCGAGGYYVYKNRDNIDWTLPWSFDNEDNGEKKDSSNNKGNGSSSSSNREEISMPSLKEAELENSRDYYLSVSNLKNDDLGYTFDINFESYRLDYNVTLEKVLVDGFDTTTTFNRQVLTGNKINANVRISKTELDIVNINNFRTLIFYFKIDSSEAEGQVKRYSVNVNDTIMSDNKLKGLIEVDTKNQTTISYYKTIDDKDNTYIYFDFKNVSVGKTQIISVKKLLINGKIYDYKSFSNEVYHGAEKLVYLTIPKKDIKKIENFTISFTMLNEIDGHKTAAYITNEYSRTL